MTSAASSTKFDVDNFTKALECPFGLDLLTEAVSLAPCMHKINEAAAKALYGAMVSEKEGVEKRSPCLICKKIVTAYYPDHFARGIIALLSGSKQPETLLPQVSSKIQAEKALAAGKIPFPGKPAKFEWFDGDWTKSDHGFGSLVRSMDFKCVTTIANPFFSKFSILGYTDGSILISVHFPEESEDAASYFKALGIQMDSADKCLGRLICGNEQAKKLFSALATHNEIPASHFDLIRTLIQHGNWKVVDQIQQKDMKANAASKKD